MTHTGRPSLVQVKGCRLFGAKPFIQENGFQIVFYKMTDIFFLFISLSVLESSPDTVHWDGIFILKWAPGASFTIKDYGKG